MNHLDLFSGIGGFALAASQVWGAEHNIVSFCEIDPFCQKVLNKHWPTVPIISDIRDVTYERIFTNTEKHDNKEQKGQVDTTGQTISGRETTIWPEPSGHGTDGVSRRARRATIDLLTGGFPCQPFSCAGKRGGKEDDRYLWPEMLRVIREIQPTWIIGENVAGIINMELDRVLSDLEDSAYEVQPFLIPACGVDATHRRDRVWIVGNSKRKRGQGRKIYSGNKLQAFQGKTSDSFEPTGKGCQDVAHTECKGRIGGSGDSDRNRTRMETGQQTGEKPRSATARCSENDGWEFESRLGGMVDGVSRWPHEPDIGRVATGVKDRVSRLKSLGNAIVPQCVIPIMQAIKATEMAWPCHHGRECICDVAAHNSTLTINEEGGEK